LRELAFLNKGPGDRYNRRNGSNPARREVFLYKEGIPEFVRQLGETKQLIHPEPIVISGMREIEVDDKQEISFVDLVLQYTPTPIPSRSSASPTRFRMPTAGMHLEGFKAGLTNALKNYAKANNLVKEKDPDITGEDLREGLVCVLSIKLTNPRFSSQTKSKLVNNEVKPVVQSVIYEGLSRFCEENPAIAKKIIEQVFNGSTREKAARRAREAVRKNRAYRRAACRANFRIVRNEIPKDRAIPCGGRFRGWISKQGPGSTVPSDSPHSRQAIERRESTPWIGCFKTKKSKR